MKVEKNYKDDNSQTMWLYKNLPLIAIKTNKQIDMMNSETFYIKYVDTKKKEIHVNDDNENTKIIEIEKMNQLFYPAYAVTTHKMQGSTVNKGVSIYEWYMMTKKMKYTALTRVTKSKYLNILY